MTEASAFKWATVTATSPLTIKLDGDTDALNLVPGTLIDPTTLSIGTRVRVELSQRKAIIHGKSWG